ncbi:hypothetical protein IYR97_08015 [Pseudomonas fulva]|uniref:Lipoprotein n=2 Tax=Pseudomonas fulva TaxID=47880 RepID=A0A7S9LAL2_9PSED|nr:hypothetical protein [Pseudomonas fulva]QPH45549.1 hypothetical protein IYR97_08015 [Pseudomonas fulva]QPH50634.1 hypothetical protein IZU98_08030 [Pseudomonas fulva]
MAFCQNGISQLFGKSLCGAALMLFSVVASAANLYKEGSTPARMFEVVRPVVQDLVTPVFLFGNDPDELLALLDPAAVKNAGISQATLDYYKANVRPESFAYGVVGYAMGGYAVPGNETANKSCAVVMATHAQMHTTSTMFHEAVHCKNFTELRADRKAWDLAASMNRPALGMTNNQFMSLFHEVLAAYVQVAYWSNQEIKDGLGMVVNAAQPDKNTATSIGFRTARNALKVCRVKDGCSTYAPDVVQMLASNSYARGQMMLDLKELFDAARASGYVVENSD